MGDSALRVLTPKPHDNECYVGAEVRRRDRGYLVGGVIPQHGDFVLFGLKR